MMRWMAMHNENTKINDMIIWKDNNYLHQLGIQSNYRNIR